MRYPILIHKDKNSDYGVTVPDLLGCFSAGSTMEEALQMAEEAILTHIEGLIIDNEEIPEPSLFKDLKKDKKAIIALVSVDLAKLSGKAKRVNVSIPERLLYKFDMAAKKSGQTRSGFLISAGLSQISENGYSKAFEREVVNEAELAYRYGKRYDSVEKAHRDALDEN